MRKRHNFSKRRAQGMTEYIIIVGLVAILLIAAVRAFGNSVGGAFDSSIKVIDSDVTNAIDR